jgi:hypothetical protein
MTSDDREEKADRETGHTRSRAILRIIAAVIGIIAGVDLAIALLARPPASRTINAPGGAAIEHRFSASDLKIIKAHNWFRTYVNPAGWIALSKGYGPDTLYQLERRSRRWRGALAVGQWTTIGALIMAAVALWMFTSPGIGEALSA